MKLTIVLLYWTLFLPIFSDGFSLTTQGNKHCRSMVTCTSLQRSSFLPPPISTKLWSPTFSRPNSHSSTSQSYKSSVSTHLPLPLSRIHTSTSLSSASSSTTMTTSSTNTNTLPQESPPKTSKITSLLKYPLTFFQNVVKLMNAELPLFQIMWPQETKLRFLLLLSFSFMILGKWVNVRLPFILQGAVDSMGKAILQGQAQASLQTAIGKTLYKSISSALILYGVSRALSVFFAEAKTVLFSHVSQSVLKRFATQIFNHLHALDSDFHLQTPSGVISVAYVRAVRGFQTILLQLVFYVLPAIVELFMVASLLYKRCGPIFSNITMTTFSLYIVFTAWITSWRIRLRNELVNVDNNRNGYLIDSLLNHEVVKLFNSEKSESRRYSSYLERIQDLNIESTLSIAVLNLGQSLFFCLGLAVSLLVAQDRVFQGLMTVGEVVAVNSMLMQLSIPFNYLGYTYQELRQAYVDMEYMRYVLQRQPAIKQNETANDFDVITQKGSPSVVEFKNVTFRYRESTSNETVGGIVVAGTGEVGEYLLRNVSFKVSSGQSVAIVGPSGSGKSTTLRLITRLVDPESGSVQVDGVDVQHVTLDSLRRRISVIPQDTSLFSDTLEANIMYGNPDATPQDLSRVVERCNLSPTLAKMPHGLQTQAGERGARLSGGERQKVSIARAMLKEPSLILCDEVTSAVDAFAERDIIASLKKGAEGRTTILIAHRLSSVVHCDNIIVMDNGHIVEQGTHSQLLSNKGVYFEMWTAQNGQQEGEGGKGDLAHMSAKVSLPLPVPVPASGHHQVGNVLSAVGWVGGTNDTSTSSTISTTSSSSSSSKNPSSVPKLLTTDGWLVECEGCDLASGDHFI